MRLSRIITAIAVGLAVSSLPAATASAQPYPPNVPDVTLSATTAVVGETITISGSNFGPNEIVDITITINPLAAPAPGAATTRGGGTAVAMGMVPVARPVQRGGYGSTTLQAVTNAEGEFSVRYRVRLPGEYTITVTGRESGVTATATLTVFRSRLPVTGSGVGTQIAVGGGLLAAGVLLVLMAVGWRRSRRRESEYEAVR